MVELYHFWSSVCSVKVRMALEEKGVKWQSRYIDLFKFDQLTPEYLRINPDGVVPTLVHNGQPILESSVINEYIDAAFEGPALVPPNPIDAAKMRMFVKACDDGFSSIVKLTMVKYILPKLKNRWGDESLREHANKRPTRFYQDVHSRAIRGEISNTELNECELVITNLLDLLERTLAASASSHGGNERWVVGSFSLADIAVAPYMYRLYALGKGRYWSEQHRPHVHAWYERISHRAAFITAATWPDESGEGYEEVGLKSQPLEQPAAG
jgi:glutathione S-transferase